MATITVPRRRIDATRLADSLAAAGHPVAVTVADDPHAGTTTVTATVADAALRAALDQHTPGVPTPADRAARVRNARDLAELRAAVAELLR